MGVINSIYFSGFFFLIFYDENTNPYFKNFLESLGSSSLKKKRPLNLLQEHFKMDLDPAFTGILQSLVERKCLRKARAGRV